MSQDTTLCKTPAPEAARCRTSIRHGAHTGPTSGLAHGYVQANLMILPKSLADEFLLFCQRNPKPCPLLAVTEPGQHSLPALGQDIDLRSDVPKYRVRSEEHTSELQSLIRISYAVFSLKKTHKRTHTTAK